MLKFENKNNGRYYYVYVEKDLLNDMVLRVAYGGRHAHFNRVLICDSQCDIAKEIDRITRRRLSRGYVLI